MFGAWCCGMLRLSITRDSPMFRVMELLSISTQSQGGQVGLSGESLMAPCSPPPPGLPRSETQPTSTLQRTGNVIPRTVSGYRGPIIHQAAGPLPDPPPHPTTGAEHAHLRGAASSSAVGFIPINSLKAINELQHLQPSPSFTSSDPEGVSRAQGTPPSSTVMLWDGKENKDGDLLL